MISMRLNGRNPSTMGLIQTDGRMLVIRTIIRRTNLQLFGFSRGFSYRGLLSVLYRVRLPACGCYDLAVPPRTTDPRLIAEAARRGRRPVGAPVSRSRSRS